MHQHTPLKALRAVALAVASLAPFAATAAFADGYATEVSTSQAAFVVAFADGYAADSGLLAVGYATEAERMMARFDAILEDALNTPTAAGPRFQPYGDEPDEKIEAMATVTALRNAP